MIVLKGGATADGAKAALSHTASMGSDDRILDGALRQAGVVRIDEFSHLFLAAKAVAPMPVPAGNRVGFVSPSGAFIVHISDLCRQRFNLSFPDLMPKTMDRLKEISPPFIRLSNPVDIFPSATVHGMEFAYREAMEAVLTDPNVDAVVSIMILTRELGMPSLISFPVGEETPQKAHLYLFQRRSCLQRGGQSVPRTARRADVSANRGCSSRRLTFWRRHGVPEEMTVNDGLPEIWREAVRPDWCDYNNHLNMSYYILIFDHGTDRFHAELGLDKDYRLSAGCSTFAVETHTNYLAEVYEGDEVA